MNGSTGLNMKVVTHNGLPVTLQPGGGRRMGYIVNNCILMGWPPQWYQLTPPAPPKPTEPELHNPDRIYALLAIPFERPDGSCWECRGRSKTEVRIKTMVGEKRVHRCDNCRVLMRA